MNAASSLPVRIDGAALTSLFAEWQSSSEPGVVVAVSSLAGEGWRVAHGVASMELPLPNSFDLRVRIGSTTKWILSLAVHLLFEDGLIRPDTRLREIFPQFPSWADPVEIQHLLRHTSGVRCHVTLQHLTGAFSRPTFGTDWLEVMASQSGVSFAPGEHYAYNNGGYHILSRVVEAVSGTRLEEFLVRRILHPLGMTDTLMKRSDLDLLERTASLHIKRPNGEFERGFLGTDVLGEGALVSTADDLLKWLKHFRNPIVGTAETWRSITRPTTLNNGAPVKYGAGVIIDVRHGVNRYHHAGGVVGGLSQCMTAPELGLDIVLLANRGDIPVQELANKVFDICVGVQSPARRPPKSWCRRGGYGCPDTGLVLEIKSDSNGISLDLLRLAVADVEEHEDRTLTGALPAGDLRLTPAGDSDIILEWLGKQQRLSSLGAPDEAAAARLIVGTYYCKDAACHAEMVTGADGTVVRMRGQFGQDAFRLRHIGGVIWLADAVGLVLPVASVIEFDTAEAPARGFFLSSSRIRRLQFVREES